jgi:hypothetical protein
MKGLDSAKKFMASRDRLSLELGLYLKENLMNINPTIGQRLAQSGLKSMYSPGVHNGKEQAGIGGSYLDAISDKSEISTEKLVSKTAKGSWNRVDRWRSQVAVADAALSAMAAGVGGSVGMALAMVGAKAMYHKDLQFLTDQARIAIDFTQAVSLHSEDPVQRSLAETALKSALNADYARTQVSILGNFLTSQTPATQPQLVAV